MKCWYNNNLTFNNIWFTFRMFKLLCLKVNSSHVIRSHYCYYVTDYIYEVNNREGVSRH